MTHVTRCRASFSIVVCLKKDCRLLSVQISPSPSQDHFSSKRRFKMSQQKAEEEVMKNIAKAFAEMDEDNSGKVDSAELREFCKRVPGMESVSECLCEIDTSDDGKITLDELTDFILNKVPKDKIKESHVRNLFSQVDKSGDGKINKSEFSTLLTDFNFTQEEVDQFMSEIGGDDGMISEEEFITAFKNSC